ncbi:hypothetical protein GCM10010510_17370 [Streptomyces anandii JCM 4720]|nr:hypothetical protein GCM10010510_17370 [Streptomyces anandii JCM 4720]
MQRVPQMTARGGNRRGGCTGNNDSLARTPSHGAGSAGAGQHDYGHRSSGRFSPQPPPSIKPGTASHRADATPSSSDKGSLRFLRFSRMWENLTFPMSSNA